MNNGIFSLHGRETLVEIQWFEKTRIKMAQKLADLAFLKKCKDKKVIPCFSTIKYRRHKPRTMVPL
jgi:hypothetical protein